MAFMSALAIGGGALLSSYGSSKSADEGKDAAKDMAKMSKQAFMQTAELSDKSAKQAGEFQMPWYEAGKKALGDLTAKIESGEFDPGKFTFDYETFAKDPSYQFRVREGTRAMEQGAAARGKLLSGQQQKALMNYGQEAGSQEYQSAWERAAKEWGMNADRLRGNYQMLNNLNLQGQQAGNVLTDLTTHKYDTMIGALQGNLQNQMGARSMQMQADQSKYDQMAQFGGKLMGMGFGGFGGGAPAAGAAAPPPAASSNAMSGQSSGLNIDYGAPENYMGGRYY